MSSSQILMLCPTRGHSELRERLIETFFASRAVHSTILFLVDDDCPVSLIQLDNKIRYQTIPSHSERGCVWPLNHATIPKDCATLALLGDDIEFRDKDWEEKILTARQKSKVVFADRNPTATGYGNHCFWDARITRALGFVAPPALRHLYVDDFYQEIGRQLHSLFYVDAGLEHIHPARGLREWDKLTHQLNQPALFYRDLLAFSRYCSLELKDDLRKIREALR
jgi:hypothetical protein